MTRMPRPLKVQKKRRFSKQRASRKVEDGSICRTDKPSSNVESRTVKFDEKRAAHSCFRSSVLRSNVSWTAEGGNSRSERVGLAVSKTRKMRASFASTLAKPPANRLRSPQRPHRSARDRHERNSRSSTRLPSLVKPLATARRQRAEKVRARALVRASPRKPIARNETSGDRIKSDAVGRDLNEAGGVRIRRAARPVNPAAARALDSRPRRGSRSLAASRPASRKRGGSGRAARHFKHARPGGAETRACSGGVFRHARRRRSMLSIARPGSRPSRKLEGRPIRPNRARPRSVLPAPRGR